MHKKTLILVTILLIVGGAAFGAYKYYFLEKNIIEPESGRKTSNFFNTALFKNEKFKVLQDNCGVQHADLDKIKVGNKFPFGQPADKETKNE